jgi:ABC-2 type transport system ATP-binding protein
MKATSGHAELFGRDPWQNAPHLHRRLAYVAGDVALWPALTGGQCLDILGATHNNVNKRRRARLIERFDLDPTKRVRDYSKGNRQKVALIAALAADAELLVLDEPTSGLDPLMEQAFQQCVRDRCQDGVTVLLSSHIMGEVEALADRVSIIRRGRTVTSGTLAALRSSTRSTVHAVTVREPDGLPEAKGVADHHRERLHGQVDSRFTVGPDHLDAVIGRLHRAGIHTLTVTPPSLDALFLQNYEQSPGPDNAADTVTAAEAAS